jgi:cytochrome b6-f complex iron-sulfur subunit
MTHLETSQPSEPNPTRRNLIKLLMGFSITATLGGVLAPIIGYLWPTRRQVAGQSGQVRVGSLAEVQGSGGLVTSAGNKPIVLTYNQRAGVKAFSAICTHLGCVVRWEDAGYIQCPCHDARFNPQTGAVISGPAPSPLPPYETDVDDDDIYVVI